MERLLKVEGDLNKPSESWTKPYDLENLVKTLGSDYIETEMIF